MLLAPWTLLGSPGFPWTLLGSPGFPKALLLCSPVRPWTSLVAYLWSQVGPLQGIIMPYRALCGHDKPLHPGQHRPALGRPTVA